MLSTLFNTLFYQPLYNGLVLFIIAAPFFDVGVIVILFTFFVKTILFPLSQKSVQTQLKIKILEPKIREIKKKYSDDKPKQAEETMRVYKENNVNPFSGILLAFIQLPIIFALFFIFRKGLPVIDTSLLYSFVKVPEIINMNFLGIINVSEQSAVLAVLVAVSAFFQMRLVMSKVTQGQQPSKENELATQLQKQMKYFFPVMTGFAAYHISGAIGLYWITSNLFMIGQELMLRKKNGLITVQPQTPKA